MDEKELKEIVVEILTWIDENFNKVNKEILFEVMEMIHSKNKLAIMKNINKSYNIIYHLNNNTAFFI